MLAYQNSTFCLFASEKISGIGGHSWFGCVPLPYPWHVELCWVSATWLFENLVAARGRFPWWCLFLKITSDGAYGIFCDICDFHEYHWCWGFGGISKFFGTHSLFSLLLGGKCVVVLSMDSWLQMEMKRICEHNTFKYHIGIPLNVCLYFERRGVLIKSGEKINTVLF